MSNKPWLVINSGKIPITKGIIGKFGGEKPHMSFWIDKSQDTRIAIWDNGDGTCSFQVTQKNALLSTPKPTQYREDEISKTEEDDGLPF